jgi:glucose-1-phosphate thymidylyltransferase
MKLIIPVAGLGKRLRPHTYTTPKPLLHVAGRTVLQHILDSLKGIKFSEVIFITGHLKEAIEDFVKNNYSFKARFIEQKAIDGTAGAIRLALPYVDEDVMILYADTIFNINISQFKKIVSDKNVRGAIWVKEVEDYQRFGVVVNDDKGNIIDMVEKPKTPISKLANIGLYYVKDHAVLQEGIEYIYSSNIHINQEYYLTDALLYVIKKGCVFKALPVDFWLDCGKFDTLLETNRVLLKNNHNIRSKLKNSLIIKPVFVDKNVVIENSIIGPNVSIASGAIINNSMIKESIIDNQVLITNAKLSNSTIGHDAIIKGSSKKLNIGASSEYDES